MARTLNDTLLDSVLQLAPEQRYYLMQVLWNSLQEEWALIPVTDEEKAALEQHMLGLARHLEDRLPWKQDVQAPEPLTEERKAVLQKRLEEIDAHPERLIPWEEVREELRREFP